MHTKQNFLVAIVTAFGLISGTAGAAEWPDKPVKFIVSGPPGGVIDVVARVVGQSITKPLGQPVVVENRAGAFGNIGAAAVAKSPPDGLTFLVTSNGPLAQNKYLYRKAMQFDPLTDFVPVSVTADVPLIIVVRADSPAKSLRELVEQGKTKGLTFGSPGNGSLGHLTGMQLAHLSGAPKKFTHVPFTGGPSAQLSLLSGQLDFAVDSLAQYEAQIKAGTVRALALTAPQRMPGRNIPTAGEAGMPDLDATIWIAVAAPRRTPDSVVRRMNSEISTALSTNEVKDALAAISFRSVGGAPSELALRMSDKVNAPWKELIDRYSLNVD